MIHVLNFISPSYNRTKVAFRRLTYYFSLFAPLKAKRVPQKSGLGYYSSPFFINGIKD